MALQVKPTLSPSSFRVFDGRWPIGIVTKEAMGWRPEGGQITDIRPTREAAATRLKQMKDAQYADFDRER